MVPTSKTLHSTPMNGEGQVPIGSIPASQHLPGGWVSEETI